MTKYVTLAITDEQHQYYRTKFMKLGAFVRSRLQEIMDNDITYQNEKKSN